MVEPVGSHPGSSPAAESTSPEDSAVPVAEQQSDVAAPVAATAAVASSGTAPVSDAAVPRTRKKRKKRRATADASQQPAVSAAPGRAAVQRGAGQIIPYAAATAAVIGGALLLRRLLRRSPAQAQQPNGGNGEPAMDAKSAQHSENDAGNVLDIPVAGAPPALVLELDPPLRRNGGDVASNGARPLLDGLTFAVSDVYVCHSDCPDVPRWSAHGLHCRTQQLAHPCLSMLVIHNATDLRRGLDAACLHGPHMSAACPHHVRVAVETSASCVQACDGVPQV